MFPPCVRSMLAYMALDVYKMRVNPTVCQWQWSGVKLYAHTCTHTHACTHTHTHTCPHIHTNAHIHTHLFTPAHTHTCAHSHTHMHTHTHTHTHAGTRCDSHTDEIWLMNRDRMSEALLEGVHFEDLSKWYVCFYCITLSAVRCNRFPF